jgi:acetoin utilization protein AcuB
MIVSMGMTRDVLTLVSASPGRDAGVLFHDKHIRRAPVAEHGRLVGIISMSDLTRVYPPEVNPMSATGLALKAITRQPALRTRLSRKRAALTRDRRIGALRVLRDGHLVGLSTKSDIFRLFVEIFAAAPGEVSVSVDISHQEDPFAFLAGIAARRRVRILWLIQTKQEDLTVHIVRIRGEGAQKMVDDLWAAHIRVLNVIHRGRS